MSSVFPVPPSWSPDMATILIFDLSRCRKLERPDSVRKNTTISAEILMFTGVQREPLYSTDKIPQPIRHAPMFDDSAPDKPTGRKRRRSKSS